LSKQFKKVTGLTPSYFKQLKSQRTNLDKLWIVQLFVLIV
jgi:hypothetical protein